jgi:hypothetical protein
MTDLEPFERVLLSTFDLFTVVDDDGDWLPEDTWRGWRGRPLADHERNIVRRATLGDVIDAMLLAAGMVPETAHERAAELLKGWTGDLHERLAQMPPWEADEVRRLLGTPT